MSVPGSGMSGTLEIYGAKPNKSLVKITIGGIGEVAGRRSTGRSAGACLR